MSINQNVETITGFAQNISIMYKHMDHIASDIAPIYDMKSPTTKILTYNRGEQFQTNRKLRQPGTRIETTRAGRSSITATNDEYAVADMITKEDLRDENLPKGLAPPINLAQDSLEKNAKDLDLGRELDTANQLFGGTFADGVVGGLDVAGSWLTPSTSTFLADYDVADGVLDLQGVPKSQRRFFLDAATLRALKRIDDLREQLKYTSSKSMTAEMLAQILEINKVVVGSAIYNTDQAKADSDEFTGKYIWQQNAGKGSAFLYNFERATKKSLNAIIQTRSMYDGKNFRSTDVWFNPEKKAWIYDSIEETGVATTAASAGYQWKDTILT